MPSRRNDHAFQRRTIPSALSVCHPGTVLDRKLSTATSSKQRCARLSLQWWLLLAGRRLTTPTADALSTHPCKPSGRSCPVTLVGFIRRPRHARTRRRDRRCASRTGSMPPAVVSAAQAADPFSRRRRTAGAPRGQVVDSARRYPDLGRLRRDVHNAAPSPWGDPRPGGAALWSPSRSTRRPSCAISCRRGQVGPVADQGPSSIASAWAKEYAASATRSRPRPGYTRPRGHFAVRLRRPRPGFSTGTFPANAAGGSTGRRHRHLLERTKPT